MKRFRHFSLLTVVAVVGAVIIPVTFQNCGKAGFESQPVEDEIVLNQVSTEAANAPFAFDASYDQISYMGCFGQDALGKEGYYTIKAGAYEVGGMGVTEDFMTYAKTQIKPIYPATVASVDQIKQFLYDTPANSGAVPQMAIRVIQKLSDVRAAGSAATLGIDYINLLADPTDDRLMDPMVKAPNSLINYFPMAPSSTRRMEAKLTYNSSENLAHNVRYDLGIYSMLTLTYSADGSSLPRTPSTNPAQAHGRGYLFRFTQPGTYPYAHDNVIDSITERNLTGAGAAVPWNCSPARRYMIVRTADRVVQCPMDSIAEMNDPNYKKELEIVRRHLKAEHWDVSVKRRCVVPREGECYPRAGNGTQIPVEYNTAAACYNANGSYPDGNIPTPWCAQFVSVCTRN